MTWHGYVAVAVVLILIGNLIRLSVLKGEERRDQRVWKWRQKKGWNKKP